MDTWSRRKAAVLAEAELEKAAKAKAVIAQERAELEEKTDAEILAELNLPEPDSLQMGDDFRGFMNAAVPERLRKRALRKLWRSNPLLANVDNLVDYGEDFTSSSVIEAIETAYQVGKGMLTHVEAIAEPEVEENADEPQELTIGEMIDTDQDKATPQPLASEPEDETLSDPAPMVKRRMRFAFRD